MSTAVAQREKTPIAAGPRGLTLTSIEDMFRFAQYVIASGMAPKGMDKPETVFIAVQMGLELGLAPMAAIQNIAVINGRPAVWGDAMLGLCRGSGLFDDAAYDEQIVGEGEARSGICIVRRLPNGKPCRRTFSVADAKRAELWSKQGPWAQYPERMLCLRARSFALRDTFADVLKGLWCAEEALDTPHHGETPRATLAAFSDRLAETPTAKLLPASGNGQVSATDLTQPKAAAPAADEAIQAEHAASPIADESSAASTTAPAGEALADGPLADYQRVIAGCNSLMDVDACVKRATADEMLTAETIKEIAEARRTAIRAGRGGRASGAAP